MFNCSCCLYYFYYFQPLLCNCSCCLYCFYWSPILAINKNQLESNKMRPKWTNAKPQWFAGLTDRWLDTTSARDAWTHKKKMLTQIFGWFIIHFSEAIHLKTKTLASSTTKKTRPDTRHKMRLVCVLFTFENNTGHTDGRTDGQTWPLIEMRRRI